MLIKFFAAFDAPANANIEDFNIRNIPNCRMGANLVLSFTPNAPGNNCISSSFAGKVVTTVLNIMLSFANYKSTMKYRRMAVCHITSRLMQGNSLELFN